MVADVVAVVERDVFGTLVTSGGMNQHDLFNKCRRITGTHARQLISNDQAAAWSGIAS